MDALPRIGRQIISHALIGISNILQVKYLLIEVGNRRPRGGDIDLEILSGKPAPRKEDKRIPSGDGHLRCDQTVCILMWHIVVTESCISAGVWIANIVYYAPVHAVSIVVIAPARG